MPHISDLILAEKIRATVWSKPKGGKTFGAATFPRPNFICFDPTGISTLAGKDFLAKYISKVNEIQYETFVEKNRDQRGVVKTHNAFDDACKYFDECMKPVGKWNGQPVGRDTFDTWVLDSVTSMIDAAMNKAIILLGGPNLGVTSNTFKSAQLHGVIVPKLQDFGSERSMVEQFIQMLLDTDKNVIVLAHEREVLDDAGNVEAITPLATGKSVQVIGAKFDEIWRVNTKRVGTEYKRLLQTYPVTGKEMVGTRYGIPQDTPWEYDAVKSALDSIRLLQDKTLHANHPA